MTKQTNHSARLIYSGHESFACRYGWIPKLYHQVGDDPFLFESDENAIVRLGIGRNMVKSIRFWGQMLGITQSIGNETHTTPFAKNLLDLNSGLDPYLETLGSLWRLHWHITVFGGLGAWTLAFLNSFDKTVTRERFITSLQTLALKHDGSISFGTAKVHVAVFLATYNNEAKTKTELDETLGSPFQELNLVRLVYPGGTETIQFVRGSKRTLDYRSFAFALCDFWRRSAPSSSSLSFRSLMLSFASPGVVLMLDEVGLHEQLEDLCKNSECFSLRPDGVGGYDLICRTDPVDELDRMAWT